MSAFRYPQFCSLARAAELLGERWTIPLLRQLLTGPQRFGDLRRRLPGLSPSVLSERLERLQQVRVVRQRTLPPPAPAVVYELTDAGRALDDPLAALTRWGLRFLGPPQPGDRIEPEWIPLALGAFARRGPTATLRAQIDVRCDDGEPVQVRVIGGRRGVRVDRVTPNGEDLVRTADSSQAVLPAGVDARISAQPILVLALLSRTASPSSLVASGAITLHGDPAVLERLPDLFDFAGMPSPDGKPEPLRARSVRKAGARSSPSNERVSTKTQE